MIKYPYYDKYLKQDSKCFVCHKEIMPQEYTVINVIEGIRVIHEKCLYEINIVGCMAQLEILFRPDRLNNEMK